MRIRGAIILLGALIVITLFVFPFWWPMVNRSPISQALPQLDQLPAEEQAVIEEIAARDMALAEALISSGLAQPEPLPLEDQAMGDLQGPTLVSQGSFDERDAVHRAVGDVLVYQLADGSWFIRLENFEVRNGPQLHLFLSAHERPMNATELRENGLGFDWGALKAPIGSQNYVLPAGFDMASVQSIVIVALPYMDIFSSAQLF